MSDEDKLAKRRRIRTQVVKEILTTEETYVDNLQSLVDVFILPLTALSNHPDMNVRVLSMEDVNRLFSNITTICELNKKFLEDIRKPIEVWNEDESCIGDKFREFSHYFKMYTQYVNNHDTATKFLYKALEDKEFEPFQRFNVQAESSPSLKKGNQTLASLLIMPIQRIPRYKLLLQEVLRNTEAGHPDEENLKIAVNLVNEVAMNINEAVKRQESLNKILELSSQFNKDPKFVDAARIFKLQGPLWKKCRREDKKFEFFLFNDLLAYASRSTPVSKWHLNRTIPINKSFFVQDLPNDKKDTKQFKFQIVNPTKSFVVYATDEATKKQWYDMLVECVSERKKGLGGDENDDGYIAPVWVTDKTSKKCELCGDNFTFFNRRHHCRKCGSLVCNDCSLARMIIAQSKERVCNKCVKEIQARKGSDPVPVPKRPRGTSIGQAPQPPPRSNRTTGDEPKDAVAPPSTQAATVKSESTTTPSSSAAVVEVEDKSNTPPPTTTVDRTKPRSTLQDVSENPVAVALYTHEPDNSDSGELSFRAGATIEILERNDSEWWQGELNGVRGHFPVTYVQELDEVPTECVDAIESYEATNEDELSMNIGDVILKKHADDQWALGEKVEASNGVGDSGWFPLAFTEPHVAVMTTTDVMEDAKDGRFARESTITSPEHGDDDDEDEDPVALVLFDYTPPSKSKKEMTLTKGEIITLLRCEESKGWWKGFSPATGAKGWFPAQYVQMITGNQRAGHSVYQQAPELPQKRLSQLSMQGDPQVIAPPQGPPPTKSTQKTVESKPDPKPKPKPTPKPKPKPTPKPAVASQSATGGCQDCDCQAFVANVFVKSKCQCQHGVGRHS